MIWVIVEANELFLPNPSFRYLQAITGFNSLSQEHKPTAMKFLYTLQLSIAVLSWMSNSAQDKKTVIDSDKSTKAVRQDQSQPLSYLINEKKGYELSDRNKLSITENNSPKKIKQPIASVE